MYVMVQYSMVWYGMGWYGMYACIWIYNIYPWKMDGTWISTNNNLQLISSNKHQYSDIVLTSKHVEAIRDVQSRVVIRPSQVILRYKNHPPTSPEMAYPLVNIQKAIENGHLQSVFPLKIVIFHSYVMLVYQRVHLSKMRGWFCFDVCE